MKVTERLKAQNCALKFYVFYLQLCFLSKTHTLWSYRWTVFQIFLQEENSYIVHIFQYMNSDKFLIWGS